MRWLVGVLVQPPAPAHVEGGLSDEGTQGAPGHHHSVHQRGSQAHSRQCRLLEARPLVKQAKLRAQRKKMFKPISSY